MKLDGVAEYMPDGDILTVVIYVVDADKARPNVIASGTCTHALGPVDYATASFDRTNGNTDGPVKVAFNHPAACGGHVRVAVTTDTETLEAIFPVTVLPMPDIAVAGNEF